MIDTFWNFAKARLNLMLTGQTEDPVLQKHRFTNCYRACDRVSQYLIKNVIQAEGVWEPEDILLRTLLFRVFNRIDTWGYLTEHGGYWSEGWNPLTWRSWDPDMAEVQLAKRSNAGYALFTGVYRITSKDCYGAGCKYGNYLACVQEIMQYADAILATQRLEGVFDTLLDIPLIGPFLAMQLTTDLGYTDLFPWSENDFVYPGPGCKRGVSKTFGVAWGDLDGIMARIHDTCKSQFEFGFPGLELVGSEDAGSPKIVRPLSLMDIQNLFCEFDKYLRVARPEIKVTGFGTRKVAKRPKQQYTPATDDDGNLRQRMVWPDSYTFPKKWYHHADC